MRFLQKYFIFHEQNEQQTVLANKILQNIF